MDGDNTAGIAGFPGHAVSLVSHQRLTTVGSQNGDGGRSGVHRHGGREIIGDLRYRNSID